MSLQKIIKRTFYHQMFLIVPLTFQFNSAYHSTSQNGSACYTKITYGTTRLLINDRAWLLWALYVTKRILNYIQILLPSIFTKYCHYVSFCTFEFKWTKILCNIHQDSILRLVLFGIYFLEISKLINHNLEYLCQEFTIVKNCMLHLNVLLSVILTNGVKKSPVKIYFFLFEMILAYWVVLILINRGILCRFHFFHPFMLAFRHQLPL